MQDPECVFNVLAIRPGYRFLDLGCGAGEYSLRASRDVGESGAVYALDRWEEVACKITETVKAQGIQNIQVITSDILHPLPLDGDSIDVCMMATVLHIPTITRGAERLFQEIHRVLKCDGRLAVINIKKEEMTFGPPLEMRLSPDDTASLIVPHGFKEIGMVDLGYNYMVMFKAEKEHVS